ncbi:sensor histidine kinase [Actinoplanes sp. CA-030573]|uniref:sensor histidine kinase n=1 Tax=Actinoplanes sp. CA-030573 TaxID=3239898 RepID=UPI003D8AF2AC
MTTLPSRARRAIDALEHLVGGLATAVLALAMLVWTLAVAILGLLVVGLSLVPGTLRAMRMVADRERARLSRWGPEIVSPGPTPTGLRAALTDRACRRELAWLAVHATFGFAIGLLGLTLPLYAVQDVTYPLWWQLTPAGSSGPSVAFWPVNTWADALAVGLLGLAWVAVVVVAVPQLARLPGWIGRSLLGPGPGADLSLRVEQLTATRAAALDAHAAELRRIERSLHDGTQNRLVAVNVLLGAARRQLARDPAAAAEMLARAQDAAEQALAELRTVARGILPPVLADRGLTEAVERLAGDCAVRCRVDVEASGRCAASVEATAYFVVAEALTNVSKHSGATSATVTIRRAGDRLHLRIDDDGHGGADEGRGSGLVGIRRRVEAYDGRMSLTSPVGGPTTMRVELPCGS